jgi:hypothetical protein
MKTNGRRPTTHVRTEEEIYSRFHPDAPAVPVDIQALIGGTEQQPEAMLDWALHWAGRELCIFPVWRFLGLPLIENWYAEASRERGVVISWWTQEPEADVAAVPDKSGHFAIVASSEEGQASLADLEARHGKLPAEFRYVNPYGDEHLWVRGHANTSHHRLGRGIHVLGAGHFVYLPASIAPDPIWK